MVLPTWLWQGTTGPCASGQFVTDSGQTLSTTTLQISGTNEAGSDCSWIPSVQVGSLIQLRDDDGQAVTFTINSMGTVSMDGNGCYQMKLAYPKGDMAWGGHYSLTFYPAA